MWQCELSQSGDLLLLLLLRQRTMIQTISSRSTPNCACGWNNAVCSWEKSREVSFCSRTVHQLYSHRGLCLFWFEGGGGGGGGGDCPSAFNQQLTCRYQTKPCAPRLRSRGKSPLSRVCLCVTEDLQKLEESESREETCSGHESRLEDAVLNENDRLTIL